MIKAIKIIRDFLPFIFIVCFALMLALNKSFSGFTIEGLKMYFACILPSLFPYCFITAILSFLSGTEKMSKLISPFFERVFKVNGACGYAFLMGLISGYPVGSIIVADFRSKNLINSAEAERASVLCSTSSPAFLISVVGSMAFNNVKFGLGLYFCHIISAIIVGAIFSYHRKKEKPKEFVGFTIKKSDDIISECTFSAINSALLVGALITLFYIFTEVLFSIGILNIPIKIFSLLTGNEQVGKGIIFGIFETTKAVKTLSFTPANRLSFCTMATLCGFSGISAIMQALTCLKKAKIKTAPFIYSKLLSAVLNFIFSFIVYSLIF